VSELDNEKIFEARLTEDLARIPAPDGFADRVMSRVAADRGRNAERGRVLGFRGGAPRSRIWMAVAATLLLAVATGSGLRFEQQRQAAEHRQQQAKAALAEQQFALAMQVTIRTLSGVQDRIASAGAKQSRDENRD